MLRLLVPERLSDQNPSTQPVWVGPLENLRQFNVVITCLSIFAQEMSRRQMVWQKVCLIS